LRHAGTIDADLHRPGKKETAELANSLGLRSPKLFREYSDPDEIDDADLPNSFVVKPNCQTIAKGVMVLLRQSNGAYRDLFSRTGDCVTIDDVRRVQRDSMVAWTRGGADRKLENYRIMIEERIIGENGDEQIPYDYKCYTFDGEVHFILQVDRNVRPPAWAFFNESFRPCSLVRDIDLRRQKKAQPGEPVVPACAAEILEAAHRISKHLQTPFYRIDTYASVTGPVIGELTPTPGAARLGWVGIRPGLDRRLGRAWYEAAMRLNQPLAHVSNWSLYRSYKVRSLKLKTQKAFKKVRGRFEKG